MTSRHVTQTGFFYTVKGTEQETVLFSVETVGQILPETDLVITSGARYLTEDGTQLLQIPL